MGTKTAKLQIRINPDERELLAQAAKSVGLSVSDYIRSYMLPLSTALLSGNEQLYYRVSDNLKDIMLKKYSVTADT